MFSTEINIIFLVYILAFIGAVIMLFLSVVLMLPASVFTQKQQNNLLIFVIAAPFFVEFIENLIWFLPAASIVIVIFFIVNYLVMGIFNNKGYLHLLAVKKIINIIIGKANMVSIFPDQVGDELFSVLRNF